MKSSLTLILGSRSPRRQELLGHLIPAEQLRILPPRSSKELGFENLHTAETIEDRLREIANGKLRDVEQQIRGKRFPHPLILTADTVIIVKDAQDRLHVLGQPPEQGDWKVTVRNWFLRYYAGQPHWAWSAVSASLIPGQMITRIVKTEILFRNDLHRWIDWYLETEEPLGKAGGYAIQGAGSVFVERVSGSLSNVVGLPLAEVMEMLEELTADAEAE